MDHSLVNNILVVGGFQSFFLTALLFRKKERALHDYIIGGWLLFLGLYILFFELSPRGFFMRHPRMISFYIALLLLIGPFLFFYIRALTVNGFKIRFRHLVHLLPFFFSLIYLSFFFQPQQIFERSLPIGFYIFVSLTALLIPAYIFWAVHVLREHRSKVAENFSSTEKKNLIWLRNLVILLGITWGSLVMIIFLHHVLHLFSDDFCIDGLFVSLALFILCLGYFGLYQEVIFSTPGIPEQVVNRDERIRYSGSSLKEEEVQKHTQTLKTYMESRKPYLNNQLTLYQLAEEVDIPPHLLSRIINECFHKNFFDFINLYRVEEFKTRILDPRYENITLLGLAFDCGFNSKSSFNRLFKEATGKTPSVYKKEMQQKPENKTSAHSA